MLVHEADVLLWESCCLGWVWGQPTPTQQRWSSFHPKTRSATCRLQLTGCMPNHPERRRNGETCRETMKGVDLAQPGPEKVAQQGQVMVWSLKLFPPCVLYDLFSSLSSYSSLVSFCFNLYWVCFFFIKLLIIVLSFYDSLNYLEGWGGFFGEKQTSLCKQIVSSDGTRHENHKHTFAFVREYWKLVPSEENLVTGNNPLRSVKNFSLYFYC